ncbi:hypothetical protein PINS_up020438 [Pythium insidiosum]|nr:hypothetical protein PINS_up020438 [Pythium insidiosum]
MVVKDDTSSTNAKVTPTAVDDAAADDGDAKEDESESESESESENEITSETGNVTDNKNTSKCIEKSKLETETGNGSEAVSEVVLQPKPEPETETKTETETESETKTETETETEIEKETVNENEAADKLTLENDYSPEQTHKREQPAAQSIEHTHSQHQRQSQPQPQPLPQPLHHPHPQQQDQLPVPSVVCELVLSSNEKAMEGAPDGELYTVTVLSRDQVLPSEEPDADLSELEYAVTNAKVGQETTWAAQFAAIDILRRLAIHHPDRLDADDLYVQLFIRIDD